MGLARLAQLCIDAFEKCASDDFSHAIDAIDHLLVEIWLQTNTSLDITSAIQLRNLEADESAVFSRTTELKLAFQENRRLSVDTTDLFDQLCLFRSLDAQRFFLADTGPHHPVAGLKLCQKTIRRQSASSGCIFGPDFHVFSSDDGAYDPRLLAQCDAHARIFRHTHIIPTQYKGMKITFCEFNSKNTHPSAPKTIQAVKVLAAGFPQPREFEKLPESGFDGQRSKYFDGQWPDDLVSDRLDEIVAILKEAARKGTNIVLLPELSVTEGLVVQIVKMCQGLLPGEERLDLPEDMIIVPGTYHCKTTQANVARVLDGHGKTALKVQLKMLRYATEMEEELLSPRTELELVHFDIGTLQFCILICIDFCDSEFRFPEATYSQLILVPSMGGDSTVRAHIAQCNNLKKFGRPAVIFSQEMLASAAGSPVWTSCFDGSRVSDPDVCTGKERQHFELNLSRNNRQ